MALDLRPILVDEFASITVTYNPDLTLLESQLSALCQVQCAIVVDNASEIDDRVRLRELIARFPNAELIENDHNLGLGAGINQGLNRACELHMRAVLLLDQDSGFSYETPIALLKALNDVQAQTRSLCCVGPVLVDRTAGLSHGFHHVAHGWRWSRAYPSPDQPPFAVANLNGSGTTMSLELVNRLGDMDSELFIDHIDTEWSFRVMSGGFGLYGIPWVFFDHRMGERGRRVWIFGWRVWPDRSPLRHYYLYRNTICLLRRDYVWRIWKVWALLKMMLTLCIVTLNGPRRAEQWRMIGKGVVDGLRKRKHEGC